MKVEINFQISYRGPEYLLLKLFHILPIGLIEKRVTDKWN